MQDWYSEKVLSAGASMLDESQPDSLQVVVGNSYHSDRLICVDNLESPNSIYTARREFSSSPSALFAQGYTGFDGPAVSLASIDKSLDGPSLRAVGFILAEDIEIFAFILITRKTKVQIFTKKSEPTSNFVDLFKLIS